MKYKISDGGATAEGFNETNDCVVRAIAIAARIPYTRAHKLVAKETGRRPRRGTQGFLAMMSRVRIGQRRVGLGRRYTVAKFVEQFPKGRYLVRKSRHAFAVVDGVVHDNWKPGPRCIITDAWYFPKK